MPPEASGNEVSGEGIFAPKRLVKALEEVTSEVFATMLSGVTKLIGSESSAAGDDSARVNIEATIEFDGDQTGTVVLRCTADGAIDITRGLLMLDDQDPIELDEVQDAIGECANMMAGSLKAKVLDPFGTFFLGLPQIETHAVVEDEQERCGSLVYELTDGHAVVEIWLKPEAEAA
ncbi:MAG: CheY-specific phosphatase CheX [Chlamydiales bacterium]|jgi:CheY-specific phosphatase CheX